jgi:hypothetical protein
MNKKSPELWGDCRWDITTSDFIDDRDELKKVHGIIFDPEKSPWDQWRMDRA